MVHLVGAKTDTSAGASDYFSANSGMHVLSSASPGGPTFTDLGELRGANNQQFGFRASAVVHPVDGALLVLTEGYAHIASPNFGFILLRSASGDPNGPWTEHLAYELEGRAMADDPSGTLDYTADPTSAADPDRWDCRLADLSLAILADGKVLIAYRGTKCCCNSLIGAWNVTGGHELETMGLLRADTWDGPFVRDGVKIFGEGTDNEDPYLWTSPRGVHMLMHSQDNAHHNHERRGAYASAPTASRGGCRRRRRGPPTSRTTTAAPTRSSSASGRASPSTRRRGGRRTCSPAWRPPRTA